MPDGAAQLEQAIQAQALPAERYRLLRELKRLRRSQNLEADLAKLKAEVETKV